MDKLSAIGEPRPADPGALPPKKRSRRPTPWKQRWPDLEIEQILAWADAHHARTGRWPIEKDGLVADTPREKWVALDSALRRGHRGLPGGSSLPQLLAEHRGVRNRAALPPFTEATLLSWADAYYARHGRWPQAVSGPIEAAPGETWLAVETALSAGLRGLPGGSSLAQFLEEHRGVRNRHNLPALTPARILAWADAHHARSGRWPTAASGSITNAPGETWTAVAVALKVGVRGLPGGSSLARLLAEHRGHRHPDDLAELTEETILAWADDHHARTGEWPTKKSGSIAAAPGETWKAVNTALCNGRRGLPGGSSLARLLAEHRGVRNRKALPALSTGQILAWADAYHARHGRWPQARSGPIEDAPGETWSAVDSALEQGLRGLPGGSSLPRLLAAERAVPHPADRPPLTEARILAWADAEHARTGRWPKSHDGAIEGAPGETWTAVGAALERGTRGLPGGSSLARFLTAHRGVPNHLDRRSRSIRSWPGRTRSTPATASGRACDPVPSRMRRARHGAACRSPSRRATGGCRAGPRWPC